MALYCCGIILVLVIMSVIIVVVLTKPVQEIPTPVNRQTEEKFCKIIPKGYVMSEGHSIITYRANEPYTIEPLMKEAEQYFNENYPTTPLPHLHFYVNYCMFMFIYDVHLADEPTFYTSLEDLPDHMPEELKNFILSEHKTHGDEALRRVWIQYTVDTAPEQRFYYFKESEIMEAHGSSRPLIKLLETPRIERITSDNTDYASIVIYLWAKNYDGVSDAAFYTDRVEYMPTKGSMVDYWAIHYSSIEAF